MDAEYKEPQLYRSAKRGYLHFVIPHMAHHLRNGGIRIRAVIASTPEGWHCGSGWQITGQPDAGANRRPVCSAEGKGSVVIAETLFF